MVRAEGAAFGSWVTSDIALPLAVTRPSSPHVALRVVVGSPDDRYDDEIPLADLGVSEEIEGTVSLQAGTIWIRPGASATGLQWSAILGLTFPYVMYSAGAHVLHASCVSNGDSAVAFLGNPRAGKSSSAAALVRRGWRHVADDCIPLFFSDQGVLASPAFPAIRLFTSMARWLSNEEEDRMVVTHPRLHKWWVLLDQDSQWHGGGPVPLRKLYVLTRSGDEDQGLSGASALLTLLRATYIPPVTTARRRGEDFARIHRLATTLPIAHIDLGADLPEPEMLGELLERRLRHDLS